MSFFSDLFGGAQQDAAQAKTQGLQLGYKNASKLYGQGRQALQSSYAAGLAPYSDVFSTGKAGTEAYGNLVGLNGPQSIDLTKIPGYNFALDQGLQAIDRGAAARGQLGSGNLRTAEQQYGTGLANQYYQNYVQNLSPYFNLEATGAQGIGSLNSQLGNELNASYGNQGNLAYNTNVGIGNAQAAADVARGNAASSIFGNALKLGTALLGFA